jgi:dienelactone hydrolase
MKSIALGLFALIIGATSAAEVVRYPGTPDALPHDKYVRVVSEAESPIQRTYIKSKDGLYVAAAIRKPQGRGPFPAIIMFHGAPGGRGLDQLVGWSRGDHGGPVWERFLQEGFVVIVADYRGGDMNAVSSPSPGAITSIDDGLAVIEHVKGLAYVDPARISVYGVSLGGNLAMFLASKVPTLHSIVVGAPAPIWFLGYSLPANGPRPDFAKTPPDAAIAKANITPIATPILIQVGTADALLPLVQVLHDQLAKHGKQVRMEIYEHGYHDFVLGPQGQQRPDMPQGEILMQGTLDALERSVKFVKSVRLSAGR